MRCADVQICRCANDKMLVYFSVDQVIAIICTSAHLHIYYLCRMNILILGSGGRESAFAWKLAQSPKCQNLFIAPGNAGTGQYGTNVNIKVTDFEGIKQ